MAAQDYEQVTYNGPDGAQIGSSATEKIGFFGAVPVAQPDATANGTKVAAATPAAAPAGGAGAAAGAWETAALRDDAITTINDVRTQSDENKTRINALVDLTDSVLAKLETLGLLKP